MIVSGILQGDSVIYIYIGLFSIVAYYKTLNVVPYVIQ